MVPLTNLIGEFECRLDDKSRVILPAGLKKQISPEANDRFVINRGFENCLVLYPMNEWKSTSEEINRLNLYNRKNRDFVRYFVKDLDMNSPARVIGFVNAAHFIDHYSMLIFAAAVIVMGPAQISIE